MAKDHTAMLRIRAGDIQLVSGNSLTRVQFVDDFRVFLFIETKHINKDRATGGSQKRHLVSDECVDTDIFQSDGVQHTRRCGKETWRQIAVDRTGRCPFDANAANAAKIRKSLEFFPIAERAASRNDWIT